MSRGFLCSLLGLAMTAFSWISPWEWPAWPALALMSHLFTSRFADLSFAARGSVIVFLILVNSACWAAVAFTAAVAWRRVVTSRP